MQDGRVITGSAIINYAKGAPEGRQWRSTVNLKGELSPGTYTVFVNLTSATGMVSNMTVLCTFVVRENGGRQGCSADTDLSGFNTILVRDGSGNVVARGTFTRRGGNRL
jgi:hypothetical protein